MSSSNPRPKRGGEEFSRNHYLQDNHSPKKPRFDTRNPAALVPDAPEEDEVLDADEIGKRGQQTKRNAVNIDGYESDSSNEGFNSRAQANATRTNEVNGAGSKDEEQNDMFADLQEDFADREEEEDVGGAKKKKVTFLDVGDIEGQVEQSKSGGHVSADFSMKKGSTRKSMDGEAESSSDSDVGDEERAALGSDMDEELGAGSKKKHAPKLDAFHLRAENEEGGFDENGNFVRKAQDPDAVYDTWMEGLSKKDIKKARQAQAQREEERRQKDLEDDAITTAEALGALISRMNTGETILEALVRLGRSKSDSKRKQPKWQTGSKNRRSHQMDFDQEQKGDDPAETQRREAVEAITGAADLLMVRENPEIYETDKELLMRLYNRETGEHWIGAISSTPTENANHWEYRWSDARDGGDIHGPYDSTTMSQWNQAGYFGEGVEFRRAASPSAVWSSSVDFE